jgi:hypothetical protein
MQHGGNGPTVLDVVTYFLANWEHDDRDDPVKPTKRCPTSGTSYARLRSSPTAG